MSHPADSSFDADRAIWIHDGPDGGWLRFAPPVEVLQARRSEQLRPLLGTAARRVEQEGRWLVAALAYEAAPAFDPALAAHPLDTEGPPLAWLALCDPPTPMSLPVTAPGSEPELEEPTPSLSLAAFLEDFARIQAALTAGEVYQVNHTFPLRASFAGDPWRLFTGLSQPPAPYAAYLPLGGITIVSASPELFFEQRGSRVWSRPMKGTAPRGRTLAEDDALAARLVASPKERAENLMVVDMIRNDLGRIAEPGTVEVPELFTVERYPTVLQMTSTVRARTAADPLAVLAALFPCASVTGAPKVAATRMIRRLEPQPRGIYTGAIGWVAPGCRARFSVAIRTAVVDTGRGELTYGVGSGVVADSSGDSEYRECLGKARVLTTRRPSFELLETLLWEPGAGYWLLPGHLERLAASAEYFGWRLDLQHVERVLETAVAGLTPAPAYKVRLTVSAAGLARAVAEPLAMLAAREPAAAPEAPLTIELASTPVDPSDPLLFHKTTHREVYDTARRERPAADEVLLVNARGELTEATRFNLVLDLGGELVTPPVDCGLLPGVLRGELVAAGRLAERVLTPSDLPRARSVWLINSVRGFRRAVPTCSAVAAEPAGVLSERS